MEKPEANRGVDRGCIWKPRDPKLASITVVYGHGLPFVQTHSQFMSPIASVGLIKFLDPTHTHGGNNMPTSYLAVITIFNLICWTGMEVDMINAIDIAIELEDNMASHLIIYNLVPLCPTVALPATTLFVIGFSILFLWRWCVSGITFSNP